MHRGETRSPAKLLLTDITEIKKNSASQIQIAMKSGHADLPYHLTDYRLMIVPNGFKDWSKADGTGAIVLEEFRPGVRASFLRKPGNYWKPNRGNFGAMDVTCRAPRQSPCVQPSKASLNLIFRFSCT